MCVLKEEEESDEESDESSEEEDEEVGEWLEEAVFGPALLTEMSAWATTHPTQPLTYTKVSQHPSHHKPLIQHL